MLIVIDHRVIAVRAFVHHRNVRACSDRSEVPSQSPERTERHAPSYLFFMQARSRMGSLTTDDELMSPEYPSAPIQRLRTYIREKRLRPGVFGLEALWVIISPSPERQGKAFNSR